MRSPARPGALASSVDLFERGAEAAAGCPRLAAWRRMAEAVDRVRDRLGRPVDPGIRDTVVALNLLGFSTSQSCEGHAYLRGHGLPAPWVDFTDDAPVDLPGRLRAVLGDFYAGPRVPPDPRLRYCDHHRRLSNGGTFEELDEVSRRLAEGRSTSAEAQGVLRALAERQAEMRRFTHFLRAKLLPPGACLSGGSEGAAAQALAAACRARRRSAARRPGPGQGRG